MPDKYLNAPALSAARQEPEGEKSWTVYMLRCGDGTLYTGATCPGVWRRTSGAGEPNTPAAACLWFWFTGRLLKTSPPPSGGRPPSNACAGQKSWPSLGRHPPEIRTLPRAYSYLHDVHFIFK